jgi:hypothetical protein
MPISLSGDGIISGVSTLNTIQTFVGTAASFTGNVSVGGTLTYEDVTNVDSIGIITARSGINVTGVVTATSFVGSGANLTNLNIPAGFNELDTALFS